jgi:hypothetical protein
MLMDAIMRLSLLKALGVFALMTPLKNCRHVPHTPPKPPAPMAMH